MKPFSLDLVCGQDEFVRENFILQVGSFVCAVISVVWLSYLPPKIKMFPAAAEIANVDKNGE